MEDPRPYMHLLASTYLPILSFSKAWFMVGVWAMTDENLCAEAITNVRRYSSPCSRKCAQSFHPSALRLLATFHGNPLRTKRI